MATVACPLPAVGVTLDKNGSRCWCRVWDTEILGGLNLEGTNRHEQFSPLSFSSPHTLASLSDSGLYIISSELVGHFTASLENEWGANKITIRLKSCATPPRVGCSSDCLRGGRGDLCCSLGFSLIKGWEKGLPHM